MSAFGSYAKETTISFEDVSEGLFLITGDTGSGKTMIFDAIMFALYNDTSGMTRGSDKMRSDFADARVETFVELEFVLRGERFAIRRCPRYERPKLRGQGMTAQAAAVELTYPDGRVETSVTVADEAVKELIGLDKNQFRQVAMLAQGEFYELTGASSSDRSVIFRKLFDTGLYENMQILFYEKFKDAKNKRERLSDTLFHTLSGMELPAEEAEAETKRQEILTARSLWQVSDFLVELDRIDRSMTRALDECRRAEQDARTRLNEVEKALEQLRRENEKWREYEQAIQLRDQLEATAPAFERLKEQLALDDRALRIVDPAYSAWKQSEKSLAAAEADSRRWKSECAAAEERRAEAAGRLSEAKKGEAERGALPLEISRLDDECQTLESIASLRATAAGISREIEEIESERKKLEADREEREASVRSAQDSLDALADTAQELFMAKIERESIEQKQSAAADLLEEAGTLTTRLEDWGRRRDQFMANRLAWERADKEAGEAADLLFLERAGYLARKLTDGEPCPVCGSTEHPRKAVLTEKAPDEEAVKALAAEAAKWRRLVDSESVSVEKESFALQAGFDRLFCQTEALTEDVIDQGEDPCAGTADRPRGISDPMGSLQAARDQLVRRVGMIQLQLAERFAIADKAVKDVQTRTDRRGNLQRALAVWRDELAGITERTASLSDALESRRMEATSLDGELGALMKRISGSPPEEVRRLRARKADRLEQLTQEYQTASEAERQTSEASAAAWAAYKSSRTRLDEAKENTRKQERRFLEALDKARFISENDYLEHRLRDDEREESRRNFEEETLRREASARDMERLTREVQGFRKRDEQAESRAAASWREKQSALEAARTELTVRARQLSAQVQSIRTIFDQAMTAAEQEKMLEDIADLASGKHREAEKISFETFVQTWYFSQVIDRANHRFSTMTNGRYRLLRSDRGRDQRTRTGLDLSVEDLWTARTRPVSTLSGGEKFQAALAMALGLSDVVSEHAGGVEIDALFIDEGFGGLDEESLQDAIRVLQSLASDHRLIGIISHVPLLRQAIGQQLAVHIDTEGSRASWITL